MGDIRDILNRYRWDPDIDLKGLRICYIHRGVPGDVKWIGGECIIEIEQNFIKVAGEDIDNVLIPLHRIVIIEDQGKVLLDRT